MSTHLSLSYTLPADPAVFMKLMRDRDFVLERLSILHVDSAQLTDHQVTDEQVKTTVRTTVPRTNLPRAVRGFVRGEPGFVRVETWSADGDDYRGAMQVDLEGVTSDITGDLRLRAVDGGSELSFACDIAVPLPIFGPQIEETVVRQITEIAEAETAFLTKHAAATDAAG